jgi:hypothetical protein
LARIAWTVLAHARSYEARVNYQDEKIPAEVCELD